MKKKITGILAFAAVVCIILINEFTGIIDQKAVLEKSNPGYYYHLKHDRGFKAQIEKHNAEEDNYFVNTAVSQEADGLQIITEADGGIRLEGTAERNIDLTIGEVFHSGNTEYSVWLDDVFCTPDAYITVSGHKDNTGKVLFRSYETSSFTADPALYDTCSVDLHIRKNTSFSDTLCRITIRTDSTPPENYIPCLLMNQAETFKNNEQILVYRIDKDTLSELQYSDFRIFFNNMKSFHWKNYDSVILDFSDGTGILFPSCQKDGALYGKLSPAGNITVVSGFLKDSGKDLYIEDPQGNPVSPDHKNTGINGI